VRCRPCSRPPWRRSGSRSPGAEPARAGTASAYKASPDLQASAAREKQRLADHRRATARISGKAIPGTPEVHERSKKGISTSCSSRLILPLWYLISARRKSLENPISVDGGSSVRNKKLIESPCAGIQVPGVVMAKDFILPTDAEVEALAVGLPADWAATVC
jgi:hypothetical protein